MEPVIATRALRIAGEQAGVDVEAAAGDERDHLGGVASLGRQGLRGVAEQRVQALAVEVLQHGDLTHARELTRSPLAWCMPSLPPSVYTKRVEIRWRDMDAFKHVNNSVYLTISRRRATSGSSRCSATACC